MKIDEGRRSKIFIPLLFVTMPSNNGKLPPCRDFEISAPGYREEAVFAHVGFSE